MNPFPFLQRVGEEMRWAKVEELLVPIPTRPFEPYSMRLPACPRMKLVKHNSANVVFDVDSEPHTRNTKRGFSAVHLCHGQCDSAADR